MPFKALTLHQERWWTYGKGKEVALTAIFPHVWCVKREELVTEINKAKYLCPFS
jgi:hypothetical protein